MSHLQIFATKKCLFANFCDKTAIFTDSDSCQCRIGAINIENIKLIAMLVALYMFNSSGKFELLLKI